MLTVSADGLLRSVVASWDSWRYEVDYSRLGTMPDPAVPKEVNPLKR